MDIFQYRDYKKYLVAKIRTYPGNGHGLKKQIAETLNCQTSQISRVLKGNDNLSVEHSALLNKFLNHTKDEADYFILIVQYARAGHHTLKEYLTDKINKMLEARHSLKDRFQFKEYLKKEEQAIYYSAWYYAAIHVLLGIEFYQTSDEISKLLNLPKERVEDVLSFLVQTGLAKKEIDKFCPEIYQLNLPKSSPLISKHHINWRLQSMKALDSIQTTNLHYTSVLTISEEDFFKLKEEFIQSIAKVKEILKTTKPIKLCSLNLDLYEVQ